MKSQPLQRKTEIDILSATDTVWLWTCKSQYSRWWICSNLLGLYHWFKIDLKLCFIEIFVDYILYLFILLLLLDCKYAKEKFPRKKLDLFMTFLSLHFVLAYDWSSRWLQEWWQYFCYVCFKFGIMCWCSLVAFLIF